MENDAEKSLIFYIYASFTEKKNVESRSVGTVCAGQELAEQKFYITLKYSTPRFFIILKSGPLH